MHHHNHLLTPVRAGQRDKTERKGSSTTLKVFQAAPQEQACVALPPMLPPQTGPGATAAPRSEDTRHSRSLLLIQPAPILSSTVSGCADRWSREPMSHCYSSLLFQQQTTSQPHAPFWASSTSDSFRISRELSSSHSFGAQTLSRQQLGPPVQAQSQNVKAQGEKQTEAEQS